MQQEKQNNIIITGEKNGGKTTLLKSLTRWLKLDGIDSIRLDECAPPLIYQCRGIILVVDITAGLEHAGAIRLAAKVGTPVLAVFINNLDQCQDEGLVDLMELEIASLLNSANPGSKEPPFVRGSARRCLTEPLASGTWLTLKAALGLGAAPAKVASKTTPDPQQNETTIEVTRESKLSRFFHSLFAR
jgi:translation elongation factor EF-Tu-like GTPase